MEIMSTNTLHLGRIFAAVSSVLLGASTASAADVVLHKVPFTIDRPATAAQKNDSVSLALMSYNSSDARIKSRALYVSSGADAKQAANTVDEQASTSYTFATDDGLPTTIIDLGNSRTVRRVSALYTAQKGSMDFYVLKSLPGAAVGAGAATLPDDLMLDSSTMKPVASAQDDGDRGRLSVEFPATTGRYIMVRWNAATPKENGFILAEVAAFGGDQDDTSVAKKKVNRHNDVTDSKNIVDAKDMGDAKDIPSEGPQEAPPPAEGPAPGLPPPPPFTFIPQVVPTSP